MKYSNEFILPHTLNDIQHQVLVGGLLGDFSIIKDGKYPRMKVDRQALDKPYIDWEYNVFKNLCKSGVKEFERFDKRYNKSHKYVSFRTRAVPAFLDYYNKWYPNNVRQVPLDIEFTPLILAVWFADDGCIIRHKRDVLTLKLSTESFGKYGADLLSSKLKDRFGEKFPIYRKKINKDQFFIKASTSAAHPFLKEIQPYIIEMGMHRKYNIWKNCDLNLCHKIGKPQIIRNDLKELVLSFDEFSINDILSKSHINKDDILYYVQKLYKLKYLDRYESNDKFNLYHYKLTELGRKFLQE